MGKLLHALGDFIFSKPTPDQALEDESLFTDHPIEQPSWYRFIVRRFRLIITLSVLLIAGSMFLLTRSHDYTSSDGMAAITWFVGMLAGFIMLPLMAVAAIQRKVNFRNTLTPEKRKVYDDSTKKRIIDFMSLLLTALIVTTLFGLFMYIRWLWQR